MERATRELHAHFTPPSYRVPRSDGLPRRLSGSSVTRERVDRVRLAALQSTAGNAAASILVQRQQAGVRERDATRQWERAGEARRLVDRYSPGGMVGFLRVEALARELIGRLPADADIAMQVVDDLVQPWKDSDLSAALSAAASDAQLLQWAHDSRGNALLFRMVRSMQGLATSPAEKAQLYRVMRAITLARGGTPMVIEVITFRSGFSALDWLGERIFGSGARGHTAVVMAGLVYSFDERGWAMEGGQAEYLARNTHRDAIGQVIAAAPDAAEIVQDRLNHSIGTGTYLLDGRVCSDAAAQSLESVLGRLDTAHNPQRFAEMLQASGHVTSTNNYPRRR